MLFRSTSPFVDRALPQPVRLSVSDLPPPSSPGFTAELNGRHNYTRICLLCQSYQGTVELTRVDCLL